MNMVSATRKFDSARKAGDAFLGVEVSWNMGESSTDLAIPREKFEELFLAAGVDKKFFKKITPEDSLNVASKIGFSYAIKIDAKTISVKPLSKPDKDTPLSIGVYYRVSVEGERDRWELGARVRVEGTEVVVCPPMDETDYPNEAAMKYGQAMADYANACQTIAYNYHISHALLDLGNELGWVSRRINGGVYFLPGDAGERFMHVLDGLEALTEDLPVKFEGASIPQYADPRTLQTWQRRTIQTFDGEIESLTRRLNDISNRTNVRENSFDTGIFECGELMVMAEKYAAILQEQLGPLKESLESLKSKFGVAKEAMLEAKSKGDTAFNDIQELAQQAASKGIVKVGSRAMLDQLFAI